MRRARKAFGDVTAVGDDGVGRLLRTHMGEQVGIARQFRAVLPRHLERLRGLDRIPLVLRDHADEIALADDARGRDVLDRTFVDAQRLGAGPERALSARQHHAAVEHVGNTQMMDELVASAHLVRQVDARTPASRPACSDVVGFCGAVPVNLTLNGLSPRRSPYLTARKLPSPSTETTPIRDHEAVDLHAETARREQEQRPARFRRRRTQLWTATFDRGA